MLSEVANIYSELKSDANTLSGICLFDDYENKTIINNYMSNESFAKIDTTRVRTLFADISRVCSEKAQNAFTAMLKFLSMYSEYITSIRFIFWNNTFDWSSSGPTLNHLISATTSLRSLNLELGRTELQDHHTVSIFKKTANGLPHLISLNLSLMENQLTKVGLASICDLLLYCENLQDCKINMMRNKLKEDDVLSLASALRHLTKLRSLLLNFMWNEPNHSVQNPDFSYISMLGQRLSEVKSIKTLELHFNFCDMEFEDYESHEFGKEKQLIENEISLLKHLQNLPYLQTIIVKNYQLDLNERHCDEMREICRCLSSIDTLIEQQFDAGNEFDDFEGLNRFLLHRTSILFQIGIFQYLIQPYLHTNPAFVISDLYF